MKCSVNGCKVQDVLPNEGNVKPQLTAWPVIPRVLTEENHCIDLAGGDELASHRVLAF